MDIYYYKDKSYRVIHKTSIKLDDKWIPCVVYECLYFNPDGQIWVRTEEDFNKFFTKK